MKLVSNQINPHFTFLDSLHALTRLVAGEKEPILNNFFEQKFCTKNILFTNAARSALGLICDTVRPDPDKKIALPAFICAVVATPFLARGYQIEWIETDENGLIDPLDFEKKAKAISLVVVPHVFGQIAPLKDIIAIAKRYDVFVVEDGAHYIRQLADWSPLVGQYTSASRPQIADAQIISFGREKVISCVSGGALLWPENSAYANQFFALKNALKAPPKKWVMQHALQPLVFSLSLPWWHWGGKIFPWLFRQLKIIPLAVTANEKNGCEDIPVCRLGLAQKRILKRQLEQFEYRTIHAQAMALAWQKILKNRFQEHAIIIPPLAFRTILKTNTPSEKTNLLFELKKAKAPFHLSDWDGVPISPAGVNFKNFGYQPGQCPKAEYFAQTYLTFPTNIRTEKRDVKAFAKYSPAP